MRTPSFFLILLAVVVSLPALSAVAGPAGDPIDASKMTSAEIHNLLATKPDETLVKLGDKTYTVGQMKAHEQKQKTHQRAAYKQPAAVSVKPAGLQSGNQKVMSHVTQVNGDSNAAHQAKLRDEAWDLNQKLKTASPTEKAQIQKRLSQINGELKH